MLRVFVIDIISSCFPIKVTLVPYMAKLNRIERD